MELLTSWVAKKQGDRKVPETSCVCGTPQQPLTRPCLLLPSDAVRLQSHHGLDPLTKSDC